MALETVDIGLDQTWRLISNAASGPFRATVRSGAALFSIGDTAPAADSLPGLPSSSLSFDTLAAKVWARGAGVGAVVSVLRTVDASNPAIITLPALTLSASSFASTLAAGADIATIGGRVSGDKIESISPNDGRIVLSSDGTKLVRGLTATTDAPIKVEIVRSHPLAPNSPQRQTFTLMVAVPALAISGTPGTVRASYHFHFLPTVTGGSGEKSFTLTGKLPDGLSFSSQSGTIYGRPLTGGQSFSGAIGVSDGTGSASLSVSFTVAPANGLPPSVEAIASNRSKLASSIGSGGAFGTTTVPYIYYRSVHRSNKKVRAPKGTFWNGAVDAGAGNAPWEHGPSDGSVATVYGDIWTGVVDPTLADQTGVTVWPLTFLGIQTGARRVKDLQYVTRTWADFVAAGGGVSGDGRTVTIPSGWSVEHDRVAGLTLEKGQRYFYALEHGVPGASSSTPKQAVRGVITQGAVDKGDRSKNATAQVITTAGKNPCDDPNWASGNNMPGVSVATSCFAPIIVTGLDDTGTTKTVAIDGDSINDENNDTLRDVDGIAHGISRALNREGYSFFKTAIFSSSMGNQRTYGGNAYRLGLLEYADAVITNHGHNDSGLLTTDASMKSIFRWHGLALRGALRGAKRVVRMTLTPTGKYATARSGGSTTSVQLASSESATNDIYVGSQIKMVTGPAAGQYGTITAYDGSTKIATVNPTNTWSVAATSGNYGINYPAQDPATDGSLVIANPFIMRTGPYAGIAFDPSVGDPDAGLDAYASYGAANGIWADILDTFDMTHPASPGAEKSAAYFTASRLTAALGFAA